MPTPRILARTTAAAVAVALVPSVAAVHADDGDHDREPELVGRAVLPVKSFADGPPAGAFFTGGRVSSGRSTAGSSSHCRRSPSRGSRRSSTAARHGEYLAMPDNGFGNKANSFDFLIRAYYIRPDFKTRHGGSGTVDVDADEGEFISVPRS